MDLINFRNSLPNRVKLLAVSKGQPAIKIRSLVMTIFFFIIFYFNDSNSVHHHKRLTFNFTQGTEFFWKNRLLIFDHI